MPPPVLLTVEEVAARLRVGTRTVWRWCKTGDIPAPLRLGKGRRVVRWNADDIEHFLQQVVETLPRQDLDDESPLLFPRPMRVD